MVSPFLAQNPTGVLFVSYSVVGMSYSTDSQGIFIGLPSSSPNTRCIAKCKKNEYSQLLLEIYNKLNSIKSSDVIQKIVDIVEDTRGFEITPLMTLIYVC